MDRYDRQDRRRGNNDKFMYTNPNARSRRRQQDRDPRPYGYPYMYAQGPPPPMGPYGGPPPVMPPYGTPPMPSFDTPPMSSYGPPPVPPYGRGIPPSPNALYPEPPSEPKVARLETNNDVKPSFHVPSVGPDVIEMLKREGIAHQKEENIFWCAFCCVKVLPSRANAEEHIKGARHQKAKKHNMVDLNPLDQMFVAKTQRESDSSIIEARKDALHGMEGQKKLELIQESIRLKDGIGDQAYICIACKADISSLTLVDEHIRSKRHVISRACATLGMRYSRDLVNELSKPNRPKDLDGIIQASPDESFLGLGSITEYTDPEGKRPPVYQCTLCQQQMTLITIKAHILSYEHVYNYLVTYEDSEAKKFSQRNVETEAKIKEKIKSLPPDFQRHKIGESIPTWAKDLKLRSGSGTELSSSTALKGFGLELSRDTVLEPLIKIKIEDDSQQQKVMDVITAMTESLVKYKMKHFSRDIVDSLIESIRKESDPRRFAAPSIKLEKS